MVKAVAPKPVNIVIGFASELTVNDLSGLGVRRISVGCGLARAAWFGFMHAARTIAEAGSFDGFASTTPSAELTGLFREDRARRISA